MTFLIRFISRQDQRVAAARCRLFALKLLAAILFLSSATISDAHWLSRPSAARSHPVSVVEANIYVNRTKTTMRLTCFAEDLELLQGVEALETGFYDSDELREATQDHAKYLAEKVTLRNVRGELIPATIIDVIPIQIPEEGIKAGQLMNFTMGFVFELKHSEPPEFITLQQDMVADGALLPSELKVLLKQAGSDTPFIKMMKPGVPETFRFDWDLPVLSQEASEDEWGSWFEAQREKTLGITSYSSVYSFIYVTRYEVRHEILVPLATLATLMELERADESFLTIAEQDAAVEKIQQFFAAGNPVKIDNVEVAPVFDRVDFYGLDLRDFAVRAERRKVSMANGRVGLIMSYRTMGPPKKVELTWDIFNSVIRAVDGVAFVYDKASKTEFNRFLVNNTFSWTEDQSRELPPITGVSNSLDLEKFKTPKLQLPSVSIGIWVAAIGAIFSSLIGLIRVKTGWIAGIVLATGGFFTMTVAQIDIEHPFKKAPEFELADEDADEVFAQLHKNLFRAFDYHSESDIYDALANSVDGECLRETYLDLNRSLVDKEQGGAVARIDEVGVIGGDKVATSYDPEKNHVAFKYRCNWKLVGTIEHWGHIHQRENKYVADFDVELRDDAWKITNMQIVDEELGQASQRLRKL